LPPLFVGNPKNPIVAMNFATAPGALAAKNFSRICTESSLTAFQSFALGGIAGSIAEMITMPAVVVRTRLMVQGASATDATQYRGFFDARQTMLGSEGIGAYYKGDGLLGSLNADTWPGGLGREDVGR
jgi:hypothetical protein